jgi:pimeloyl-ACP methyl ester carboxylesterase
VPISLAKIKKVRADLQQRFHRARIAEFIECYDKTKPSMVILPGGMGSRIHRTPLSLVDDPDPTAEELKAAWMGIDTFLGGALHLRMSRTKSGVYVDSGREDPYVALPNGPVDELRLGPVRVPFLTLTPYTNAILQLRDTFNIVVFGYDWRRRTSEAAEHLAGFLGTLEERVKTRHDDPDVLAKTTLVGHSQGGLVAAAFLWSTQVAQPDKRWCERMVSLGAPFYGTTQHQRRYFKGENMLRSFYQPSVMSALVATMPGLYALLYPSADVYQRDFLGSGNPELPIYPLLDGNEQPVFPGSNRAFSKFWPPWIDKRMLREAEADRRRYTTPLPEPVRSRVFHVRQAHVDHAVYYRWKPWDPNFDPDEDELDLLASHPRDAELRASDGTVPYWSARLAGTPMENVMDYVHPKVGHRDLMAHPETINSLIHLERNGSWPTADQRKSWGTTWARPDIMAFEAVLEAIDAIKEAIAQLTGSGNPEARLLEHADAGELLRNPRFWVSLDEGGTP